MRKLWPRKTALKSSAGGCGQRSFSANVSVLLAGCILHCQLGFSRIVTSLRDFKKDFIYGGSNIFLLSIDLIFVFANRCLLVACRVSPFLYSSSSTVNNPRDNAHPPSIKSLSLSVAQFIDYHESCAYHVTFSPHDSRQQQRRWQGITAPLGSFCNAARNPTCPYST